MKCFQIDLNELLRVVLLGRETLIPPNSHRTRKLDEYVLYVVTNGCLHLRVNEKNVDLVPGDIYLFDVGDFQTPSECGFCEYYYVHFRSERIRAWFIRKNQQYLLPNARKYDIIISSSITTRQATQ